MRGGVGRGDGLHGLFGCVKRGIRHVTRTGRVGILLARGRKKGLGLAVGAGPRRDPWRVDIRPRGVGPDRGCA
ncbi:hypothetical protein BHE74_00039801 [Ensete ventricosum]|nr:hypothetical protein BHE74_00039801 [Ensete ventricosum]